MINPQHRQRGPQPIAHQRPQSHLQRFAENRHTRLGILSRFARLRLSTCLPFLLLLVGCDTPICNANDAVRVSGDVAVVGYQNDRVPLPVQLLQNCHDLLAAPAVQRSSRFIGQDRWPAVVERAGDADALLLAAGDKLVWVVLKPVAQSEFSQQVTGVRPLAEFSPCRSTRLELPRFRPPLRILTSPSCSAGR